MDVTKFKGLLFIILILFQKAYAQTKTNVKFLFNLYSQNGDGGDQIYDNSVKEDVDVIAPMLFVVHQVDEKTKINAHFVFDTWTNASDNKLDANTGASGEKAIDRQARFSGNFGLEKDYKSWKWSSRLGISKEYDYRSINIGGSWEGLFVQDNFVLSISPQLFLDQAKDYDLKNNRETDYQGRVVWSIDFSASQLISRNDIWKFGYTFIYMNGMNNNISNSVYVNNNPYSNNLSRVEERLPSRRIRHAPNTQWVHAFTDETALDCQYRYYFDDWDLSSHTISMGLRQSFFDDNGFIYISYRFHNQLGTKYWKNKFEAIEAYMTSDSDLAKFNSHRIGASYSYLLGDKEFFDLEFEDWNLSTAIYVYDRSNDLNYYITQIGISSSF